MKKNVFYSTFSILASMSLGYFLGKIFGKTETLQKENPQIKNLHLRNEVLSRQLSNSKTKIKTLEGKITELESSSKQKKAVSSKLVNTGSIEEAFKVFGKTIKINDLKLIEGIGPKIEQILKSRKIDTWQKLSTENPKNIRQILIEEGGEQYHIHNPDTWPQQAKLAAESKWDELKTLQDNI